MINIVFNFKGYFECEIFSTHFSIAHGHIQHFVRAQTYAILNGLGLCGFFLKLAVIGFEKRITRSVMYSRMPNQITFRLSVIVYITLINLIYIGCETLSLIQSKI